MFPFDLSALLGSAAPAAMGAAGGAGMGLAPQMAGAMNPAAAAANPAAAAANPAITNPLQGLTSFTQSGGLLGPQGANLASGDTTKALQQSALKSLKQLVQPQKPASSAPMPQGGGQQQGQGQAQPRFDRPGGGDGSSPTLTAMAGSMAQPGGGFMPQVFGGGQDQIGGGGNPALRRGPQGGFMGA
jgi:hypothetical protein